MNSNTDDVKTPGPLLIEETLMSGVKLKAFIFSLEEVRYIYSYQYRKMEDGPGIEVDVLNDFKLVLDYTNGILSYSEVNMHIIIPSRLGQQEFAGVDISPGAKTYVEFVYKSDGTDWLMSSAQVGCQSSIDLNELRSEKGFVQHTFSTFPILDRIKCKHGNYYVPYLDSDDNVQYIKFAPSIRRD